MLKTKRGVIKWFFLTIITLGIYPFVFIHKMSAETNETCRDDNEKTKGLIVYILLGIITLGIYTIVWNYNVCERHRNFLHHNNETDIIKGSSWILWNILGAFIGVGPIIGLFLQIKQWNKVNAIYNKRDVKVEAK